MTPEEDKEIPEAEKDITNISDIKNTTETLTRKLESNENVLIDVSNTLTAILNEMKNREKDKVTTLPSNTDERFRKSLDVLEDRTTSLENDISVLQGNLMALEQNLSKAGLSNVKQKFDSLQNAIDANQSELYDKTNELTEEIHRMQEKIPLLEIYRNFENQMGEIISRLVFFESRITAMENTLHDVSKYSPIVVE